MLIIGFLSMPSAYIYKCFTRAGCCCTCPNRGRTWNRSSEVNGDCFYPRQCWQHNVHCSEIPPRQWRSSRTWSGAGVGIFIYVAWCRFIDPLGCRSSGNLHMHGWMSKQRGGRRFFYSLFLFFPRTPLIWTFLYWLHILSLGSFQNNYSSSFHNVACKSVCLNARSGYFGLKLIKTQGFLV